MVRRDSRVSGAGRSRGRTRGRPGTADGDGESPSNRRTEARPRCLRGMLTMSFPRTRPGRASLVAFARVERDASRGWIVTPPGHIPIEDTVTPPLTEDAWRES